MKNPEPPENKHKKLHVKKIEKPGSMKGKRQKTFGCAWPSKKLPRGDHAEVTPIPHTHFSVLCLPGKLSLSICKGVSRFSCFFSAKILILYVSQPKAHLRALVNYLLIDVTQVYKLSMIWELALNAASGVKHISQQTQTIFITFIQRRSSTLVQHCSNVIKMFCVCWDSIIIFADIAHKQANKKAI